MARHNGDGMIIQYGTPGTVVQYPVSFSIEETAATYDQTAAGEAWETHNVGKKSWSGTIELRLDDAAEANQGLRAGEKITFTGYSDGDESGKTFYTGEATLVSVSMNVQQSDTVGRTWNITGNGPLTKDTVT